MNDYITKYSHVSDHTSQCAGKSSTILYLALNIIRINCAKTSIFRTLVGGLRNVTRASFPRQRVKRKKSVFMPD